MDLTTIIMIAVALLGGAGLGYFLAQSQAQKTLQRERADFAEREKTIHQEAREKAETEAKEKILESKERFMQQKSDQDREINRRKQQVKQQEQEIKEERRKLDDEQKKLEKREAALSKQAGQLDQQRKQLEEQQKALENAQQQQIEALEKVAGLSAEEAAKRLEEQLKQKAESRAKNYVKQITDEARLSATKQARKIVLETVQRVATEQTIDNCISVFNIDNDDIKGRIIGREGRNIRAMEAATGVEIIVDDTPEAIILSAFDPVRREVARLSLHRLVSDGRIHPARIEEVVKKVEKQIEEEMMEIGEKACIDLGIHGMDARLVRMVGKMRYRSSYGQNLLQHSREVARFCSVMAAEMGLSPKLAKRAGLLHDIGKVADEGEELPHAIWGMKLAEQCEEHPDVCNAIGAHHDEVEMTTPLSPIIQVCDAVSGARPGARREMFENYIKRLHDLEEVAKSFNGVQKVYAIQAGRELRVIAESEKVSDQRADELSFDISQKIQNEMTYPGQIKVTVIREKRSVAYAK